MSTQNILTSNHRLTPPLGSATRRAGYLISPIFAITCFLANNVIAQSARTPGPGDIEYSHVLQTPEGTRLRQPVTERGSRSGIVTQHQLMHRVPKKAVREWDEAVNALKKKLVDPAIEHFQTALSIDPEFCEAFYDLGTVYLLFGEVDNAIEQFQKAIEIDPEGPLPYSNLALAFLKKQSFREAELAARRAVHLNPINTHAMFMLGVSTMSSGRFTPEAERYLKRASDDFSQARVWLALGLMMKGDTNTARDHLKTYLARGDQIAVEFANRLWRQLNYGITGAGTVGQ